jgi:pimeloyl-ACP methyl ester carboxylesterase
MQLPVERIRTTLSSDGEFGLAARYWSAKVALVMGDDRYALDVADGTVADFRSGPVAAPDVVLSGPDGDWAELLAPVPRAYFQDVLSGARFGFHRVTVEGDQLSTVFPYYQALRRVVDVMREALHETAAPPPPAAAASRFDAATGRYVYLTVAGLQHRVYFEESGSGVPLLLQHTAGSDGRQFRHLLEDPELRQRHRMIAYDLPYHGKSNPPAGTDWWAQEYRLTSAFLLEFVSELCAVLELDRPIFCGCSIGGLLAPDLACHRPDLCRAVIALNGTVKLASKAPDQVMHRSWFDPRVASDWHAAWMLGRTSPHAPEAYRRETAWYYAQAGPGILRGDLHYYQFEHDLDGLLGDIDTRRCAVYVVTGEYDPSRVAPFGAAELAEGINGARYTVVGGAGHFMMSEDPDRFRGVLMPILDEIMSQPQGTRAL